MSLILNSTAFIDGGDIPVRYTCEGNDISPPLSWQGIPENTRSLVLIIDDPDAPDPRAPKMTWVHWVVFNMPAETTELPEGVSTGQLPAGTKGGINDWHRTVYGGPCPPIGRHRYFHKLYALDTLLNLDNGVDKKTVEAAMQGHIIDQASLVGYFQKSR